MAGDKFLFRDPTTGKVTEDRATEVSTGTSEAGDIVALDSTGKLDPSLFPAGFGEDLAVLEASEAISAGSYVNVFDDAGVEKIRLADSTVAGREAHAFVRTAIAANATGTIYFEGANDALTGLTIGSRYYLTSAGGVTTTVPSAPTDVFSQLVGVAISATAINTDIDDCIGLIA